MRRFLIAVAIAVPLVSLATLGLALSLHFHRPTSEVWSAFRIDLIYRPVKPSRITRGQAIAAASRFRYGSRQVPPGVRVNTRFGLYTDHEMCTQRGNGPCRLDFVRVPAWVVAFTGPLTCGLSDGPVGSNPPTPTPAQAAQCAEYVPVDARTAKPMGMFN